jgi:hypothetical protein|tara:strand:- start:829 stop:1110 length:282 start_codon:yes stop_codon:yes gene_type:complete
MEQTGPTYYRRGSIEPWDFIRDQGLNYHLGNAIKYICRAGYKDDYAKDLIKAIHYLENELENVPSKQSGDRISPSVRYTELLESEGDTEVFDR